jgi:inner membrane protein
LSNVSRIVLKPRRVALVAGLVAVVAVADLLNAALAPPVGPGLAALDDPAHLATAAIALLAFRARRTGFVAAALVMSVAIDLDHLPRQLGSDVLTSGTTRPYTHSLAGVLFLTLLALAATRRRDIALGVAAGMAAHFLRDIATGGGLALFWPLTDAAVRVPYVVYAIVVIGLAVVAVARGRRPQRSAATASAATSSAWRRKSASSTSNAS